MTTAIKRRRTPQQLSRQERIFDLSVMKGLAIRQISAVMHVCKETVMSDLRAEEERRSEELGDRREAEKARAVAFYQEIISRALEKSDQADKFVMRTLTDPGFIGKNSNDRSLSDAIAARARIDKILGLDAPTKIEFVMQTLIDALNGEDEPGFEIVRDEPALDAAQRRVLGLTTSANRADGLVHDVN